MRELGILMSAEMVRAILVGTKTQTRRLFSPTLPRYWRLITEEYAPRRSSWLGPNGEIVPANHLAAYQVGDHLYVRETFAYVSPDEHVCPYAECNVEYRADTGAPYPGQWPAEDAKGNPDAPKWRPSIHMPKAVARIWLEVTEVRAQRLQEISFDDAIAEGVTDDPHGCRSECRRWFQELWDSLNAKRGYPFKNNPWVWAYTFRRIRP